MDGVYRSKVDGWLVIVLVGGPVVLLEYILDGIGLDDRFANLLSLLIVVVILGIFFWLYWTTRYTITGDFLLVKSGPFTWVIPTDDITGIEPTRNPSSSPALSLDRLAIRYGHGAELVISPRDKAGFMAALKKHLRPSPAPIEAAQERKPNV